MSDRPVVFSATALRPEEFFVGRSIVHGIFQDRFGRPRRQLVAEVRGAFENGILILEEDFTFDDGATEERTWYIQPDGNGGYEATANGVVGRAIGETIGTALRWRYTFALDIGSRTLKVQFDDWMCQQSDTVLINRATVRKWGVRIGDLTLLFTKRPAEPRST